MPIDYFFRSLAEDQQERAIGIILSGTGTDGTLGLQAIKGSGGMVVAQDPETTQYDGMPCSAIATGEVDHVRPVEEIPAILVSFIEHAYVKEAGKPLPEVSPAEDQLCLASATRRGRFARADELARVDLAPQVLELVRDVSWLGFPT